MILLLFKLLLILFLASLIIILFVNIIGSLLPTARSFQYRNSVFAKPQYILDNLQKINHYPYWIPDLCAIKDFQPESRSWKEYYRYGITMFCKSNSTESGKNFSLIKMSKDLPIRINRTYKIWQENHFSFIMIEDVVVFRKPYMRFLSVVSYRHKEYLRKEMKHFEKFLESSAAKLSSV